MYKESDIREVHFLLDTISSLRKYMPASGKSLNDPPDDWWMYYAYIGQGYKLVIGYDPSRISPSDIYGVVGLSPGEVTLTVGKPFRIMPATQVMCGFRCNPYRPVLSGIDIFGCCDGCNCPQAACTLGFIAVKGSDVGIVSANHCIYGTVCGSSMSSCVPYNKYVVQPSPICGGSCPGNVIAENAITYDFGTGDWVVDAAWARLTTTSRWAVLDENAIIKDLPVTARARDPVLGEPIAKYGRGVYTFSTRQSTVQGIGASVTVCCPQGGACFNFVDQIVTGQGYMSEGDSGSGTFSLINMDPVGLNFAGDPDSNIGVMARAVNVEKYLGITIASPLAPTATTAPPIPYYLLLAGAVGAGVLTGLAMAYSS
jgi:hypothetical protein